MARAQRNFIVGILIIHVLATAIMVVVLSRSVRRIVNDYPEGQLSAMATTIDRRAIELNEDSTNNQLSGNLKTLGTAIDGFERYFWTCALALSLLTGVLIVVSTGIMLRPLGMFVEVARKIGLGQYESFPALLNRDDQWRTLADALRRMQIEMANREKSIVKKNDRLQTVLSSMIEGVISVAPDGGVLIANRAACRILAVEQFAFRGKKLLEVVRKPELSKAITKTQSEQTFTVTEFAITHDEHERRTISARVSALPQTEATEQGPPGFLVVLNDITELRQLETMRQDFVANVSHELKTPLASIKAYAETLRLGAINDPNINIKFIKEIEENAEFLHQQILELLQIARIESGNEVWDITPVNLNDQSQQAQLRFAKLAHDGELEIETHLSDQQPQTRADADGVATILNNLIANAIHHTPPGGTVSVATYYEGNFAVLEVKDTGIGIAAEHQTRVFERFYRVDKARSRDVGGTGLGLSIVKHLAQSFGGNVELQSAPQNGTTFRIRLPKFVT